MVDAKGLGRLKAGENGQALAEFALVLPMLALLTFGTIEVALWLQQQSSLNAAAFLASRSASVVGGDLGKTRTALASYVAASPPWLAQAVQGMKGSRQAAGIQLQARTDRFTGVISAMTGGQVQGFDVLSAAASLPLEYEPGRHENAKTGPKSRFLVSYRVEATEKALAPAAVVNAGKAVEAVKKAVREALPVVKVEPAPAAPGAGKPPGTPGAKLPTGTKPPAGGGQAGGSVPPIQLPDIRAIEALRVQGEAYQTRGAVPGNPKDHGKANSGSYSSLFYLSPHFEARGDRQAPWTTKVVAEGLKAHEANVANEGTGLARTCENVARFVQVAQTHPVYGPYVKGFERKVRPWTQGLTKGLDTEAKTRDARERVLFGR
ncbi:MAG: TadE family protein [Candidatus Sericytochromatia bacterium]|nr:TadE family protein [Candidatus Sericytochromatia bacterium]